MGIFLDIYCFGNVFPNGTFLVIGAYFVIAIHVGELAVFYHDAHGTAAVQNPAVAAEKQFFFHLIPPQRRSRGEPASAR